MRLRLSAVIVAFAAAMLAASAAPALSHPASPLTVRCCGGGAHLGAALHGSSAYPNARGHADYDSGMMGGRHFDLDMWNLSGLAGRTLTVSAGSQRLGTTRVGRGGRCHFERFGGGVPRLTSGSTVRVRTSGGTLVASGTLRRH